uniref:Uncharacterized protein n=1 Tax=Arundo donax TaxID=35708 RepID=A0A0A9G6K4_ARUDO
MVRAATPPIRRLYFCVPAVSISFP